MANIQNFPGLYDHSPVHQFTAPGNRGPSATSNFDPVNPPPERQTPRHIVGDNTIGPNALSFAKNYLQGNKNVPSPVLLDMLSGIRYAAKAMSNSTEYNSQQLFNALAFYFCGFVEESEGFQPGTVSVQSCQIRHGIRPDGKCVRQGTSRVILEYEGRRALDRHSPDILRLAWDHNGAGTELRRSQEAETDARSIIFKLGSYMIMENRPWAIIFGADYFIMIFLNRVREGPPNNQETYHHLHISPRLPEFHDGQQNNPNLLQAMIAMLLGGGGLPTFHGEFTPEIGVPIEQRYPPRQNQSPQMFPCLPPGKASAPARHQKSVKAGKRQEGSTNTADCSNFESISLSSPASSIPARTFSLSKFSGKMEVLGTRRNCLPIADYTANEHERNAQVYLYEEIGYGATGSVSKAMLSLGDSELRVVVKLNEKKISMFYSEASVYNSLPDKSICPRFYGAFVGGKTVGQQFGAIILEELRSTFRSEEDMSEQQKIQAFQHVSKLHEAGIHHGDPDPLNFGCNGRGEVVVYDFSHSVAFKNCDANKCSEIQYARRIFLGE